MDTVAFRARTRFVVLAIAGVGFALLWAALVMVLSPSAAHAKDEGSSEGGVLRSLTAPVGDVADKVVKPVADKVVAPVVKPVADKVVKPVADEIVAPVVKPVADKVVKPVADEIVAPIVKPVADKVVKPVADKVVAPVVKPVADKVVTPVVENVVMPVATPVLETVDIVVAPAVEPVLSAVDDVVAPVTDAVITPIVTPISESLTPTPDPGVTLPGPGVVGGGTGQVGVPSSPETAPPAPGSPAPVPAVDVADTVSTAGAASVLGGSLPSSGTLMTFGDAVNAVGATVGSVSVVLLHDLVFPMSAPALSGGAATLAAFSSSFGGVAGLSAVLPFAFLFAHRAWVRRGMPGSDDALPAPFFDTDVSPD